MSRYVPNLDLQKETDLFTMLKHTDTKDLFALYFEYETAIQHLPKAQTYEPEVLHKAIKIALINRMARHLPENELREALSNIMEFSYVDKWSSTFNGIQQMIKRAPNANVDYINAWRDIVEGSLRLQMTRKSRKLPSAEPIRSATRIEELPPQAGAGASGLGVGHQNLYPDEIRDAARRHANEEQLLGNHKNVATGQFEQYTNPGGVLLPPPQFPAPSATVTVYHDNDPIQIDPKNLPATIVDDEGNKIWVEWWEGLNHDGSLVDNITKHPVFIHGSLLQYCKKVDHPIEIGKKIYQLPARVPGRIYEDGSPLWVSTSGEKWQKHDYDYKNNTLYVPYLSLFDFDEDSSEYKAAKKERVEKMVQESIPESDALFYNTSNIADKYEKYLADIQFVALPEEKIVEKFIERQNEIQKKFERERKQWFKKMLWMQFNYPSLFDINYHHRWPTVLFEDMYLEQKKAIQVQPSVEEQIDQSINERVEKLKKEQKTKKSAETRQERRNVTHAKALEKSEHERKLREQLGSALNDPYLVRRKQEGGSQRAYEKQPQRLAAGPNGFPIKRRDGTLVMEDDPNANPIIIRKRRDKARAWNMLCVGQSWKKKTEAEKEQIKQAIQDQLNEFYEKYDADRQDSDDERAEQGAEKRYTDENGEYDNTTTPLAWVIKTINEIDNDLPRTEINEEVRKVVAHYNFFTDHNAPDFNDDDAVQLTWKILELEDQKFNEGERKLGQSKAEKKEEADEKKTEDARVQRIREEECDSDIEFEKEIDEMSDEGRGQYSATLSEQDEKSTEGSVSDSDDEKTVFAHHSDVEKEENETQPLQSQKRRKKDRSMIELQNEARRGSSQGGAAGGAAGGFGSSSWNSLQGVGAGRTDQGGDAGGSRARLNRIIKKKK